MEEFGWPFVFILALFIALYNRNEKSACCVKILCLTIVYLDKTSTGKNES